MGKSIEERFVYGINKVNQLDDLAHGDHPLRFAVWKMQEAAQKILADAVEQALLIAAAANYSVSEFEKTTKNTTTEEEE